MKRIYHNHELWEEVKYNMYGSINPVNKDLIVNRVIFFFRNEGLIRKYMLYVIKNFKYSCEHNLTNVNMNRVAWLGQAAVAAWNKIPEDITRIAWNYLTESEMSRANKIAQDYISYWEEENAEKIS